MSRLPLIGVTACTKQRGSHSYPIVGDKYVRALVAGAGGLPLVIPALGDSPDLPVLVASLDGVLFTHSPSNVEPHHRPNSAFGTHHDPERDYNSLLLIKAAIAAGVPLLGIRRGFQAINLAFGGSLHQHVQEVVGYMEQRKSALPRTLSGLRCGLSQARESTLSSAISARL